MEEYFALGHMEEIPDDEIHKPGTYYLPHHAVLRSDGSKKIRVVFNGSRKASNCISLNDFLYPGKNFNII